MQIIFVLSFLTPWFYFAVSKLPTSTKVTRIFRLVTHWAFAFSR